MSSSFPQKDLSKKQKGKMLESSSQIPPIPKEQEQKFKRVRIHWMQEFTGSQNRENIIKTYLLSIRIYMH